MKLFTLFKIFICFSISVSAQDLDKKFWLDSIPLKSKILAKSEKILPIIPNSPLKINTSIVFSHYNLYTNFQTYYSDFSNLRFSLTTINTNKGNIRLDSFQNHIDFLLDYFIYYQKYNQIPFYLHNHSNRFHYLHSLFEHYKYDTATLYRLGVETYFKEKIYNYPNSLEKVLLIIEYARTYKSKDDNWVNFLGNQAQIVTDKLKGDEAFWCNWAIGEFYFSQAFLHFAIESYYKARIIELSKYGTSLKIIRPESQLKFGLIEERIGDVFNSEPVLYNYSISYALEHYINSKFLYNYCKDTFRMDRVTAKINKLKLYFYSTSPIQDSVVHDNNFFTKFFFEMFNDSSGYRRYVYGLNSEIDYFNYTTIAKIFDGWRHNEKSIYYYKLALISSLNRRDIPDVVSPVYQLMNLSFIYLKKAEKDSALFYLDRAFILSMKLNDMFMASVVNIEKARLYYHYNEFDSLAYYVGKVEPFLKNTKNAFAIHYLTPNYYYWKTAIFERLRSKDTLSKNIYDSLQLYNALYLRASNNYTFLLSQLQSEKVGMGSFYGRLLYYSSEQNILNAREVLLSKLEAKNAFEKERLANEKSILDSIKKVRAIDNEQKALSQKQDALKLAEKASKIAIDEKRLKEKAIYERALAIGIGFIVAGLLFGFSVGLYRKGNKSRLEQKDAEIKKAEALYQSSKANLQLKGLIGKNHEIRSLSASLFEFANSRNSTQSETLERVQKFNDYFQEFYKVQRSDNLIATLLGEIKLAELWASAYLPSHMTENYSFKIINYVQDDYISNILPIPAMLVNNCITNSIKHGMKGGHNNIIISISAQMIQNDIIIKIDDDGCGINFSKTKFDYEQNEKDGIQINKQLVNYYNQSDYDYIIDFSEKSIIDKAQAMIGRGTLVTIKFTRKV